MAKKITVRLDEKEIKKLSKQLKKMSEKIKNAEPQILNELADIAFDEINKNYSKAEKQPAEEMDFFKNGSIDTYRVGMRGTQAIYSEFGTGTRGEAHQHPKKNDFGLNPYNSGRTIRKATTHVADKTGIPEGELYWTYKDGNGEIQYTQGVEAQKIVYDASKTVRNKINNIIRKRVKEALEE